MANDRGSKQKTTIDNQTSHIDQTIKRKRGRPKKKACTGGYGLRFDA